MAGFVWGGHKALPRFGLLLDGGDRRGVRDRGGAPGWSRPRPDHEPLLHTPQVQSKWMHARLGKAARGPAASLLPRGALLPQGTKCLEARCSQLLGGMSKGATMQQTPRPVGQGGRRGRHPLSGHPFTPLFLLPLQNNILVVKDDSNHPMSVVSSTKSRWVMQGDSHYGVGRGVPPANPSSCRAPDPPKWALTPFSPPAPPDWPCSMGMDTSWITSASPSSTTSSRASSTSTPPAKRQRSCSETALVSRLPTALHHSFLSVSVRVSISPPTPWPPARVCLSPPAPTLHRAAMSREPQHGPEGNGLVSFFWGTALPLVRGEGGGTGKRAMCSVRLRGGGSSTPLQACH